MPQYDNTNSGVMFKNDRKTKETQPGWKGTVNIGGQEYWVSGWVNEIKGGPRRGEKMISMQLQEKEPQHSTPQAPTADPADEYEDDIPF